MSSVAQNYSSAFSLLDETRFRQLIGFLLLKVLILLAFIAYSGIHLAPDEAQYWTWSKALDWGYYSKPPGIAWQIWLTTSLFGSTEIGIRVGALIIGFALPIIVYLTGKSCALSQNSCFYASLAMAFSLIGISSSFYAITDGGLALFWSISCFYICQSLKQKNTPNPFILGSSIFLGALFKWPIYFLWLIIFPLSYLKGWKVKEILCGFFISILALLPSLYWNYHHQWVTFRHVFFTIVEPSATVGAKPNFTDFIGAQVGLLSPIFALIFACSLLYFFKNITTKSFSKTIIPEEILFLFAASGIPFCSYIFLSLFKKMQGNWCSFIYPQVFVIITWYALEKKDWKKTFHVGLTICAISSATILTTPFWPSLIATELPYKLNLFKHQLGWENLAYLLQKYDTKNRFLFTDKYQTASLLSFYNPQKKQSYFFNLQKIRLNQFSFWSSMQENETGKDGFFISIENEIDKQKIDQKAYYYQQILNSYFSNVQLLEITPILQSNGLSVKYIILFDCRQYNGKVPEKTFLY